MAGSDEVKVSIDIDVAPAKVWALVTDPDRLDEWVTIHRKLNSASDNPLKDGSKLEQTLCLRGANFKVKWEVAEFEEGKLLRWEGRGPARSKATTEYRLETDGDGGTRFGYTNSFKAPLGPLGSVASKALVGGLPEREAKASLKNLKKLLESQPG